MIKTLKKLGVEGTHLNVMRGMYDKPTGSIIPQGFMLSEKSAPLKIRYFMILFT